MISAQLSLLVLFCAAAEQPFVGHYGTYVTPPAGMKVVKTMFGENGDELIFLGAGAKPQAVVRVSLKAVSGDTAAKAATRLLEGAKRDGVVLRAAEAGEGAKIWVSKKPAAAAALREDAEYLYQVNAETRAQALAALKGLRQEPLARWKRAVAEARKKGGDAFNPDAPAPAVWKSGLVEVPVPAGYGLISETLPESRENVVLYPKRHAALLTTRALLDASLYGAFEIVQVQVSPKDGKLKKTMERLVGYYVEKHALTGADFKLVQTHDGWTVDRLRPSFLRHAGRELSRAQVIVVAGDPALADRVAQSAR